MELNFISCRVHFAFIFLRLSKITTTTTAAPHPTTMITIVVGLTEGGGRDEVLVVVELDVVVGLLDELEAVVVEVVVVVLDVGGIPTSTAWQSEGYD